jgi:hypothetical protein
MNSTMSKRALPRWIYGIFFSAAVLGAAAPSQAKVDLVTLPGRDTTELTIYNSQDLTLVRETRTLSFSKGVNEIQFSWANTLIDPTSLQIDLKGAKGLTVLDAVYPANTTQLIVWNIEAEEPSSAPVEISYFSSGLSWSADYIVKANAAETDFELQQFTTVRNNSGEDFDNAVTRVVVGEVNLVELIADLAKKGITVEKDMALGYFGREMLADKVGMRRKGEMALNAAAPAMAMSEAKEIVKKAVSEYYLFAVEGKEEIKNGWGKELPNPKVAAIPFDLSYEIDARKYGASVVKFYKLKNETKAKLGKEPLPDGTYYVYSDDGRSGMRFEGSTSHKYIPLGEDIELNLGSDGLVLFEQKTMASERGNFDFDNYGNVIGWDETRTVNLEVKNSRDRKIPLKLTHYLDGDWEFIDVSDKTYEKMDRSTVRWNLSVEPKENRVITYKATFHNGTRATAN